MMFFFLISYAPTLPSSCMRSFFCFTCMSVCVQIRLLSQNLRLFHMWENNDVSIFLVICVAKSGLSLTYFLRMCAVPPYVPPVKNRVLFNQGATIYLRISRNIPFVGLKKIYFFRSKKWIFWFVSYLKTNLNFNHLKYFTFKLTLINVSSFSSCNYTFFIMDVIMSSVFVNLFNSYRNSHECNAATDARTVYNFCFAILLSIQIK